MNDNMIRKKKYFLVEHQEKVFKIDKLLPV